MIYFRRTTAVKRQFLNYTLSIGAILAFPAQHFVCVIPVSGGAPRQVRPDFESAASPIWSPDGKRILFAGARRLGDGQDWWVTSLNGGAVFKTGAVSALAHQGLLTADVIPSVSAWTGAHVYFAGHQGDSTDCWRFRISHDGHLDGPAERLTHGTAQSEALAVASPAGGLCASCSPVLLNRSGCGRYRSTGMLESHPGTPNRRGVWIKNLSNGVETLLTDTTTPKGYVALSRDASQVAFGVGPQPELHDIYHMRVKGGPARKLCGACGDPVYWFGDGRRLLIIHGRNTALASLEIESGRIREIARAPELNIQVGRLSADDRWAALPPAARAESTLPRFEMEFPWRQTSGSA